MYYFVLHSGIACSNYHVSRVEDVIGAHSSHALVKRSSSYIQSGVVSRSGALVASDSPSLVLRSLRPSEAPEVVELSIGLEDVNGPLQLLAIWTGPEIVSSSVGLALGPPESLA